MTAPALPVLDANGLLVGRTDGLPAAHPCGDCVEYSIYGVCWRGDGCGAAACEIEIAADENDASGYCAPLKFVFTATKIAKAIYGPHAAPADGTLTTTILIDHAIVAGPTIQDVLEGVEYSAQYVPEEAIYFASGWHAIKCIATWKDEGGAVVSSEQRTACVFAAVRPSGEDALALHDVRILPGSAAAVCIDEDLKLVRMLGPYRAHADADFVLETWGETITTWADHCLCPDECQRISEDGGGRGFGIDAQVSPIPGTSSTYDITPSALEGNQDWTGCLPSNYPLYVDLYMEFFSVGGIGDIEINGVYIRFWTASDPSNRAMWEEVSGSEIELTQDEQGVYVYDGTLVIPPCVFISMELSLSNRPQGDEYFDSTANWSSRYSSDPNFVESYEECPYEGDLSDLVPATREALLEWIAENPPEE